MRGNMELIDKNGEVVGEGRLGEFLHVERSGDAVTLCIDLGSELVLETVPPGPARHLSINPEALLR